MADTSDKKIIKVSGLTVSYEGQTVLSNLSFDVQKGSILAVIGPNGSGKTTLLKAILGLIPRDEGEILVFSQPVQEARQRIGYIPQRFSFDKTFPVTIREFLSLSLFKKENQEKKVAYSLKEVGMQKWGKNLLGELSGGQLQRVLIARAILNEPELLFLDEPAAGIDIGGEKSLYELIRHLNEVHNVTVVMVSHEIDIVMKFATEVICLNKKLICQGIPHKALNQETLTKLYGQEAGVYEHKFKGKGHA